VVDAVQTSSRVLYQHFDKPVDGRATCKHCQRSISCYGQSSSNLHKHLAVHKIFLEKVKRARKTAEQPTLQVKKARRPISITQKDQESCDFLLVCLLCRDYLPFQIVESPRFKAFVYSLNSSYRLPTRATVSSEMIPALAGRINNKIGQYVQHIQDVCLTSDGWTSRANENYLAVTAHFIDNNLQMQSFTIGVQKLVDQTTAGHVEAIKQILDIYAGLEEKVRFLVTDGASVMKSTAAALKFTWFHCFPHRLNLTVQENLKLSVVSDLLNRMRSIVNHFRKSPKSWAALQENLKKYQLPTLKLVRDVETR
jgi:zinc finger BED domain-containing protein 1 (E3 SUMO-protein ligase ZBED1)